MSRSVFSLLAAAVTVGGLVFVVWASRAILGISRSGKTPLAVVFLLAYCAVLVLRPSPWPVIDVAVLTGAVGGVLLLQGGLRTPGAVVAFLAMAAAVDVVSMSGGLSRILVERYRSGAGDLLLYLTLVVPVRGRAVPIVGIGDLLVGGAAATALLRLGLGPAAVIGSIGLGLLAALAYGLWRGGAPALPFIAVAVFVLVQRHQGRAAGKRGSAAPALDDGCGGA